MNDDKSHLVATYHGTEIPGSTVSATHDRKADIGELIIALTNLRSILIVEDIQSLGEHMLAVNCKLWLGKRLIEIFPDLHMSIGIGITEDRYRVLWKFDRYHIYINEPGVIELRLASDVVDHILRIDHYLGEDIHPRDIPCLKRINIISAQEGEE